MAGTKAIAVFESVYRRTDQQIRDIMATYSPGAEVDTINVIIGDGANVLVPGVAAAIWVDFRATITAAFLQEFDGTSGSVVVDIEKAPGGTSPSFASIVGSAPPSISSARYGELLDLSDWTTTYIERGDVLRYSVTSATSIMRVLVALRVRRLEP